MNSRVLLCYILHEVRSFGELLRSLRESAFSSPRIDVFLPADSCFPECGIITFVVFMCFLLWFRRYLIDLFEKINSDLLLPYL